MSSIDGGTSSVRAYAEQVVRSGLNLRPGRRLIVWRAPVEAPDFVAAVAEYAYRAGARLVVPMWSSDAVTLARFRNAPPDSFGEYASWSTQALHEAALQGDSFLLIPSSNPDLLRGEDERRVSQAVKTESRHMQRYLDLAKANKVVWTVIALPSQPWALKVFPELPASEALARLWREVLSFCRVDRDDPAAAWRSHVEEIAERKRYLNARRYRSLRFAAPGTRLTVGLPPGHLWQGGQAETPEGVAFSPNMPTEEVFTLPHRDEVEGTVVATKPLYYGGLAVEDFTMTFRKGKVISVSAKRGERQLEEIVATDEGAARLGEVALVSHRCPVAQSGRVFFHPLIDENAACHLAMGLAYRFCLERGAELSEEEFLASGGNGSMIHIDFMIGSGEMSVYGVGKDGREEAVLKNGDWAF